MIQRIDLVGFLPNRNLCLLGLLLCTLAPVSYSQWQWQNPLPQGSPLWGVDMIDESTIVAVGYSGTIIRSTNAGVHWTIHKNASVTTNTLLSVSFCSNSLGIAAGENGTLLRTIDGGITWQSISIGIIYPITHVEWINCQRAFALSSSALLKTSDAGATWSQEPIGGYYGISFVNPDTGFLAGSAGRILRTTDSGITWTPQQSGTNVELWDVCFANSDTGFAIGGGFETQPSTVVRTTNGGATWMSQPLSGGMRPNRISFFDARQGIIVGSFSSFLDTRNGTAAERTLTTNLISILSTTNAGESWTMYPTGGYRGLYGLSVTSSGIGTVVGEYGTIFRTENSGTTWNLLTRVTTIDLNSVAFVNRDRGIAVGNDGIILRTTNGGNVWSQRPTGTIQSLYAVAFANADKAYAVGSGGVVFRTSDGGESWTSRNIPTTAWLLGLSFSSLNTCTVVSDSGIIFRTIDDGITWQIQTSRTDTALNGISFADSNTGIAVGSLGAVYVTSNGGDTWRQRQLPFPTIGLEAVQFTSAKNAWAAGDGIYRTTDAGETWTRIAPTGSAYDLHFINDDTGVIVGPSGFIFTTNGGTNWGVKYTGIYGFLYSIALLDINDVVAVGAGGTILRTSSGLVSVPEFPEVYPIPDQICLEQNYPNPFNPVTTIRYYIPRQGYVRLDIFDLLGRRVAILVNGFKSAGPHEAAINSNGLASAVYFYRLETAKQSIIKKMVIVK